MISYYDINLYLQVVFLAAQFVGVCIGICLLPTVFREKAILPKLLVPLGSLLSGAMLVIYSANVRSNKMRMLMPEITRWLSRQPVLFFVLLLAAILGYFTYVILRVRKIQNSTVTPAAIKQSMDKLPAGLCFCYENGRTVLVNHRMHDLCHRIVGRDLQNAALFWRILKDGEVLENVTRLEAGENPTFRLPDDSVWAFSRKSVEGIYQLSAVEITQVQKITDYLQLKKQDLDVINKRLRKYGENIDELTRSGERMETKARIHRELGKALLVTRKYVVGSGEVAAPFSIWETIVAMLRSENTPTEEDPLAMFLRAADQAGIEIKMTGTLPEQTAVKNLFIIAAVEALVNAVRHGQATALSIDLTEDGIFQTVRFTNNGKKPAVEITEGGGLGSLRSKVKSLGGEMKTEHEPEFALTISVLAERSEE